MSGIHYPALVVDTEGWIELLEDRSQITGWTYIGIKNFRKKQKKIYILDSDNKYWGITNVQPHKPLSGFRVFLANTIYNPKVSVKFQEQEIKGNSNSIFIEALKANIERDDDVYTQFSEKEDILKSIDANQSFKELTNALRNTGAI